MELMQSTAEAVPVSKTRAWTGRFISAFIVLFLVFDGVGKFVKPAPVVDAFARLGFQIDLAPAIGGLLLACTVLYVIPQTSIAGAILLTGYLRGAVASQLRIGEPWLTHVLFPVYCGALVWAGLFLRNNRLRAFMFPRS